MCPVEVLLFKSKKYLDIAEDQQLFLFIFKVSKKNLKN